MRKSLVPIILFVLCVSVAFTVSADTSSSPGGNIQNDEEIINAVLEHFQKIAAIPRPSGHEEKVSLYLYEYAEGKGFHAERDRSNNVIVDIPATPGLEKLPKVALQGHMDMVCVSDNADYDPENDPIEVIREGNIIHANGTSLGADDGIGVAMILCVMDGLMPHGPIRVIFTTDEEVNTSGAANFDPSHLADCLCLINLDIEDSNSVILGCASFSEIEITSPTETIKPEGDQSMTLRISGLTGGHSAQLFSFNRLNAIKVLINLLHALRNNGLSFALASFSGGTASNVVPSSAECEIVISGKDTDKYKTVVEQFHDTFRNNRADAADMKISFTENERLPEKVFSTDCTEKLLNCTSLIPDIVLDTDESNPGTPVTTANLGAIKASPEGISLVSSLRSRTESQYVSALNLQREMFELNGFAFKIHSASPVWEYAKNNPLRDLYCKVFEKQTGHQPKQGTARGALECALFIRSNPDLQMISIGPDTDDTHSVRETTHLPSIVTVWRALAETLAHIDECANTSAASNVQASSSDAA